MASIAETGFGDGFCIGLVFTLFVVFVLWICFKLACWEEEFKGEHLRNCIKLRTHLGRDAIDYEVKCWLFTPVLYLVKIRKHVYARVIYDFMNTRFEYDDKVYFNLDALIDQIKQDYPCANDKEPNHEGKASVDDADA